MSQIDKHDYDYIIIGSGFGGSVSALRLAEKGYKVAVIERGKRYKTEDFGESLKDAAKIVWRPEVGLYGIQETTILKHALILRGSGVGGGSLTYANTQLQPSDTVLENPIWSHLEDWKTNLKPKYDLARKMLGTVEAPKLFRSDEVLLEAAKELRADAKLEKVGVGIYFGDAGKPTPDPYFDGEGPERAGCDYCGSCMSGCTKNAKNTLDKNYLYLAEKLGVTVIPEYNVTSVEPLDGHDGSSGYEITATRVTGIMGGKIKLTSMGIVCSAGALGTLELLLKMKGEKKLPNISKCLGTKVRTNSESLVFAGKSKDPDPDICKGFSISGIIKLDENTTTEIIRMGKGMDAMGTLTTQLTGDSPPVPRFMMWMLSLILHPISFLRRLNPFGWGERSFCVGIMQDLDSTLNVVYKRSFPLFHKRLVTQETEPGSMPKAFIPQANFLVKKVAKKVKADPQSFMPDAILNKCVTAHIMGGCTMGKDTDEGVIDKRGNVFGYQNLKVVDASMIPVNLAVNPSLTITALAEYAMDGVDSKVS